MPANSSIRNIGRTTSLEDLRNIVVTTIEGRPILLRQVANVDFAPKVKRGDAGYMSKPAVIVSVEKQPNVDTVQLTQQITQVLAELEPSLPSGVKANEIIFRQASFIENSIQNVERVLFEAAPCRGRHPVRVSSQLAHDGHFADGDPGLDPDHGHHLQAAWPVDQHDDPGRPCHRHRRAGR